MQALEYKPEQNAGNTYNCVNSTIEKYRTILKTLAKTIKKFFNLEVQKFSSIFHLKTI